MPINKGFFPADETTLEERVCNAANYLYEKEGVYPDKLVVHDSIRDQFEDFYMGLEVQGSIVDEGVARVIVSRPNSNWCAEIEVTEKDFAHA